LTLKTTGEEDVLFLGREENKTKKNHTFRLPHSLQFRFAAHSICWVDTPDALILAISDRIKTNILPSCLGLFDVFPVEHQGKTIIHIVVSRGTEKPYYLKKFGQSPAGCFVRIGSGVQQMTVSMIDKIYAARVRNSLRNIPAPTTRKLTFQQLKIYYQEKGFTVNDAFLDNLDLYTPDHELNSCRLSAC